MSTTHFQIDRAVVTLGVLINDVHSYLNIEYKLYLTGTTLLCVTLLFSEENMFSSFLCPKNAFCSV